MSQLTVKLFISQLLDIISCICEVVSCVVLNFIVINRIAIIRISARHSEVLVVERLEFKRTSLEHEKALSPYTAQNAANAACLDSSSMF